MKRSYSECMSTKRPYPSSPLNSTFAASAGFTAQHRTWSVSGKRASIVPAVKASIGTRSSGVFDYQLLVRVGVVPVRKHSALYAAWASTTKRIRERH